MNLMETFLGNIHKQHKVFIFIEQILCTYFSVDRNSCYMVRADEIFNQVSQDASGKSASQGKILLIYFQQ